MCLPQLLPFLLNGSAQYSLPQRPGSDWFDSTSGDVLEYVSTLQNQNSELELLEHSLFLCIGLCR